MRNQLQPKGKSPVLDAIFRFIIRYCIRFIQLPLLFALFFLTLVSLLHAGGTSEVGEVIAYLFLSPLFWLFRYPLDFEASTFTPIFLLMNFWILIIHIIAETYQFIQKKQDTTVLHKIVLYWLWISLGVACLSLIYKSWPTVDWVFIVMLFGTAFVGYVSLVVSAKLLQASNRGIRWHVD